ncbi:hypothetical protein JCM24511_00319 [Saitozyma sp. JCM 24511]|nr:hypothetical protein JCM24511_00319 [Saitozyma sp. JCM 24511]
MIGLGLALILVVARGAQATVTGQEYCNPYMCITGTHDDTTSTDTYTLSASSSMSSSSNFGWAAIGFGTQMSGSPMIITWPNSDGSFTLTQRQSRGHDTPSVVSNPSRVATLQTASSFSNSSGIGMTFTLPSSSSTTNSTELIWAYGNTNPKSSSSSANIQQHVSFGTITMALLTPITNSTVSRNSDSTSTASGLARTMLIAHVVCGAFATMLVIPAAVLVPRYARGLSDSRWWFPVHGSAMGIVALALVTAAFIIAVTNFTGGFNSNHRKVGLALFLFMIGQVLLGIYVHWFRNLTGDRFRSKSGRSPTNFLHMIFGIVVVIAGFATTWEGIVEEWGIWSGTGAPSLGWKVGWVIIVGITALAYVVGLIFLLPRQRRREAARRTQAQQPTQLRPITRSFASQQRYQHLHPRNNDSPPPNYQGQKPTTYEEYERQ